MSTTQVNTAIILAAGQGRKSWPYGITQNKAVFPVATRPLIAWTTEALLKLGVKNIAVVLGYRSQQVRHALRGGKNIAYVEQTEPLGTAQALDLALEKISPGKEHSVLVLYGDVLLTESNLQRLLQASAGAKEAAMLVFPLEGEASRDWICAQVEDELVRGIVAHPRENVSHRIGGAFLVPATAIRPFLTNHPGRMQSIEVGQMPPDEAYLEESLQMMIGEGWQFHAIEAERPFVDVDKPWHLLQANTEFVQYLTRSMQGDKMSRGAKISAGAFIDGHVRLGKNSRIGPGCFIKGNVIVGDNTVITEGAVVEAHCMVGDHTRLQRYCQLESGSAIGHHCFMGHGAEFSGLMMDRAYFYHYGEYWGILGTACDLGAATVCGNLRFDDDQTVHRIAGRKERPGFGANAAYLGDYVRTGVNTILMPGVKVGPYSVLGAGSLISGDIPERTLVYVEQQLQKRQWGPEKYGW